MSEQNVIQDEVGQARGPQAAAQEALGVEIAGKEGDGQAGDQAAAPGAPPQQGPDQQTWAELLRTGFESLFGVMGSRWPKMAATEKEIDALTKAWAPVMEKHAGPVVPIEYIAVGATLLIVAPKAIGALRDARAEKAAKRAEAVHRDPGTVHP
jgi:hypothetical protein